MGVCVLVCVGVCMQYFVWVCLYSCVVVCQFFSLFVVLRLLLSSVRAPGQLEEVGWASEPWVSQESSEDHGGYDCFLMAFDTYD